MKVGGGPVLPCVAVVGRPAHKAQVAGMTGESFGVIKAGGWMREV